MKISYILKEGDNATSDIFYFSIEDNGKIKMLHYTYLGITLSGRLFTLNKQVICCFFICNMLKCHEHVGTQMRIFYSFWCIMSQLMQTAMASYQLLVGYTLVTIMFVRWPLWSEDCWQWQLIPHGQLCMLQKFNHARWSIDGFGIMANYWIKREN